MRSRPARACSWLAVSGTTGSPEARSANSKPISRRRATRLGDGRAYDRRVDFQGAPEKVDASESQGRKQLLHLTRDLQQVTLREFKESPMTEVKLRAIRIPLIKTPVEGNIGL